MDRSFGAIEVNEPSEALVIELKGDKYAAWQSDTEEKLTEAGFRAYVHTFRSTRERFYNQQRVDDVQDAWNDRFEDATRVILATLPPSFKSFVQPVIKEAAGEATDLTTLLASITIAITAIRDLPVSTMSRIMANLRPRCRPLDQLDLNRIDLDRNQILL
jgi:hypothetical protein